MSNTFYADISEFQPYVSSAYPYSVIALRGDTGYRTDNHFVGNWNHCKASAAIQVVIVYVVYIPGQNAAILNRLKSHLGTKCPSKVAFMIDMESGSGFAGPGDHSTDANALATALATYAGSQKRVIAYANHYDYSKCWPHIAGWLKKVTASYGTSNPGTWAWQYYGAQNYPTASGFPRSCPPFGSWVDLNVIAKDLASIKIDLGLTTSDPLMEEIMSYYASKADFENAMRALIHAEVGKYTKLYDPVTKTWDGGNHTVRTVVVNVLQQLGLDRVPSEVDAIKKKDGA